MKLIVVFAQRKCDYPGQYAPEALDCATDYQVADNPTYFDATIANAIASREFEAVRRVDVTIDGSKLLELLTPAVATLPGQIGGAAE